MNKLNILGLMVLMLGLAACGGGNTAGSGGGTGGGNSGGGGTQPYNPPPTGQVTISGTVRGLPGADGTIAPLQGVTIRTDSGVSTTTNTQGVYALHVTDGGTYVIRASDSAGDSFTPASITVPTSGNGANVTGQDFTIPEPTLTSDVTILWPCEISTGTYGVCTQNMATGTKTDDPITDSANPQMPEIVVPMRGPGQLVAYDGLNARGLYGGTWSNGAASMSLADPSAQPVSVLGENGVLTPDCTMSLLYPWFDTAHISIGNVLTISVGCQSANDGDIFVVVADGSDRYIRVTNDTNDYAAPVFAGYNTTTGSITVLYLDTENGTVYKVVIDTPDTTPVVGTPTVFETDVVDSARPLSVNADYTAVAMEKLVNGTPHIVVKSLVDGTEADRGPGTDPYWDLGGSNLILYSGTHVMSPDGLHRMQFTLPSNLTQGSLGCSLTPGCTVRSTSGDDVANIVFAPPTN